MFPVRPFIITKMTMMSPSPSSTVPAKCSPAWTPSTTQKLSSDNKTSNESFCSPYFEILDHFFEKAEEARLEVLRSPLDLLQKLEPARTTGDVHLQALMQQFTGESIDSDNRERGPAKIPAASRGDKSTFLPQHVRERESFQIAHPQLTKLLQTLEATVRTNVKGSVDLTNTVSVQLAMYPGDGVSGYPQHCDVSRGCVGEGDVRNASISVTSKEASSSTTPPRILTALYYLTPSDWSADDDGGYLRLVLGNNKNGLTYHDVAPYLNRFVIFRSDKVPHQVMPSKKRDRLAITMWFYGSTLESPTAQVPPTLPAQLPKSRESNKSQSLPPPLELNSDPDSESTIFVSIAAFCDSETVPTLQALFETAQFLDRIVVGLVWQHDPEHDIHQPPTSDPRIRLMTLHAKDARGPCYARHLAQLLYRNEDFVLQIDSHMRFRRHWDTYLIEQLLMVKSTSKGDTEQQPNVIITTYPVGYTLPNKIPSEVRPTVLVPWKFDESGMLRQRGRLLKTAPSHTAENVPVIPTQALYAAGFNFSRGASIRHCPYPTWDVFFGEEVYRAVQFHQAGYQFFAPAETVVYHLWSRNHRPVHVSDSSNSRDMPRKSDDGGGKAALRDYLNNEVSNDTWKAMGVDWRAQRLLDGASLGKLSSEDAFVTNATLSPGSLEGQVADLEPSAKALIQSFLGQL